MAKVSIATLETAPVVNPPEGFTGGTETQALFNRDTDPIHVHLHRVGRGDLLRIGPKVSDCLAYVWHGNVEAAAQRLASGSSFIVEHGASMTIRSEDADSLLLTFAASRPPAEPRAGGHIHLLPSEHVPRLSILGGTSGVGGGIHADASCPTCELWLHENTFPPRADDAPAVNPKQGVHSHSEDEVIFVTSGQICLGTKLCGPGTAVAIAADTMYSFTSGPMGLSFVNFRVALPSEIRMSDGGVLDEVAFWKTRLGTPRYISLDSG